VIPELGHYALVLALVLAVSQATLPMIGAARGVRSWMGLARVTALGQLLLVGFAFVALARSFAVSDFSVALVQAHSHSLQPTAYRIAAVWGNHEGSLLLWVLILVLFGALVAAFGNNLPPRLKARALGVQAMISVGFLLFMLLTSNPFARLEPAPLEGAELNPLLQDPGLVLHPPLLYLGYVGFSMAFSFAAAALIEGRIDAPWARWVRPWALLSWTTLTAGIALGSRWAYYELGWGGWWFWDPVENASFMPWLMGTALLHSAIVVEKRDSMKAWTILLAIMTFGFSLLGTFLVRSGVITSVHAFAQDPTRGLFILMLLAIAIGAPLSLFAWRAPALKPGGLFAPISREGALLMNNLLLATACATVLLGTLYPLALDVLGAGTVSVGAPYYAATFVPLMAPLLLIAGFGPFMGWKRGDLKAAGQRLIGAGALALLAATTAMLIAGEAALLAAIGVALGAWLVGASLTDWSRRVWAWPFDAQAALRRARNLPRAAYGMTLAHLGLGIAVIGMTASSAWKAEEIRVLAPGQSMSLAGYEFRLEAIEAVRGENYLAERARFSVLDGDRVVTVLEPERRQYMVQPQPTTEAAIASGWKADLYAVLGEPDGKGGWTVRLYHEPLINWIWAGAALMVAGGLVSLSDRRYRVGAPNRARSTAPARA
jgi:cytochrome c-type biogenesis protein CcmF